MPRIVKFGVIPLLLLVAAAGVASLVLDDGGSGGSPEAQVIERLIPGAGEQTPQQGTVGIDLITGWDATLEINGIPIPDAELDRMAELGLVTFTPGEGKVIEALQPNNCATARYWQLATPEVEFPPRTWCFSGL